MNRLRHWSASLVSRVDWMVGMVENHEALADSAIRDLGRHAARAKVQMGRVRSDGKRLRQRLADEQDAQHAWRERAKRLATTEEARALECVRRAKASERRIRDFEERVAEHERIEHQLGKDLGRVEEKLTKMKSQRNLMRTRESRAEALNAVGECHDVSGLDDVFERWDTRITERELVAGCTDDGDALDFELSEQEAEGDLRDELSRLMAEDVGTPPAP